MDDLRQEVAALARRVQALEDELAIHRQIVRYGFAVDTGDADGAAALFTEDSVYDVEDRKSTRLNSSHSQISYAVFCLKKKNRRINAPPAHDRHISTLH